MPTHQPLTNPLDALLLGRVRRWIEVVFRQRTKCGQLDPDGRPWTRLPASDLARQLEEQEGLNVSVRRIQRSLVRLAEAGYLGRQQRGIWRRDFWYSFDDAEWELQRCRPTVLAQQVTHGTVPSRRNDASAPTVLNLDIPSNNQNLSKRERKVALRLSEKNSVSSARGSKEGHEASSTQRRRGTVLEGLQRVVQRASARGFAPCTDTGAPDQPETWVDDSYRYTRLPSGHLVKDSLLTAPVR